MIDVTEGRLWIELEDGAMTIPADDFAIDSSAQHDTYMHDGERIARFIRSVVARVRGSSTERPLSRGPASRSQSWNGR